MKRYTPEDINNLPQGICWTIEQIRTAFNGAESLTAVEILDLTGPSFFDKRYVFLRCDEFFTDAEKHELACKFAELVLPIFESRYPGAHRPRQAIEAKRAWLRGEITADELLTARRAAYDAAADAAAYAAADAAAYAAAAAAYAAAYDAAADAAAYAADAAAYAAAYDAAADAAAYDAAADAAAYAADAAAYAAAYDADADAAAYAADAAAAYDAAADAAAADAAAADADAEILAIIRAALAAKESGQ